MMLVMSFLFFDKDDKLEQKKFTVSQNITIKYRTLFFSDAPCGDMTWMSQFLKGRKDVEYTGNFSIFDQELQGTYCLMIIEAGQKQHQSIGLACIYRFGNFMFKISQNNSSYLTT